MEQLSQKEVQAVGGFRGPIPGQSLTNDPTQKYPWEKAPKYNNVTQAQLFLLGHLTEKEMFIDITDAVSEGVPIDILTRTILFDGYSNGYWDADLMMLLVEPTAIIIMALAERVGLDYVLFDGDQDEHDEEDLDRQRSGFNKMKEIEKSLKESIRNKSMSKGSMALASEVQKGLEAIPSEVVEAAQQQLESKSLLEKDNA
jgi:hypothetical protein